MPEVQAALAKYACNLEQEVLAKVDKLDGQGWEGYASAMKK